ncbi:MAG: hypothetical protein EOP51_33830, partial [Sphingobacteriales bacterium]
MLKFALVIIMVCGSGLQSFPQDSAGTDTASIQQFHDINESEEGAEPFLAVFGLIAISIMLGIAAATFVIIMAVLLFLFLLIAGGVVSTSIGVAIYRKSVASGVRTLVFMSLGLIGAIGGIGLGWLIWKLFQFNVLGYN